MLLLAANGLARADEALPAVVDALLVALDANGVVVSTLPVELLSVVASTFPAELLEFWVASVVAAVDELTDTDSVEFDASVVEFSATDDVSIVVASVVVVVVFGWNRWNITVVVLSSSVVLDTSRVVSSTSSVVVSSTSVVVTSTSILTASSLDFVLFVEVALTGSSLVTLASVELVLLTSVVVAFSCLLTLTSVDCVTLATVVVVAFSVLFSSLVALDSVVLVAFPRSTSLVTLDSELVTLASVVVAFAVLFTGNFVMLTASGATVVVVSF
uniref:(northern house mosquito) hypothetical protein n=1 Tax=Culex pipiens TaxID=7175 RepID=A0A8D8ATR7_CULPI